MKPLLILTLIATSFALIGCSNTSNSDDVSINPSFVQTQTLPTQQTPIQPIVKHPAYPPIKRTQGMVPLVTQADVRRSQHTAPQPHRVMIHEVYHPVNPVTTSMVEMNGKTLPLGQAPHYLHTLHQHNQNYLNKTNAFTHAIEHLYIDNQKLTPVQTHALLQYMKSRKRTLRYNNLQNLPMKPEMKFDLHLKHIIVDGQTLTGPAAIGFVNGLVAGSQSTAAAYSRIQTMPHNSVSSHMSHQDMQTMTQHPAPAAPKYMSDQHNNVSHQQPMHHHMPPPPNAAIPTTSTVPQPQQDTGLNHLL